MGMIKGRHSHVLEDHITPEIIAQLNDKSDDAKLAKINKVIGHINEAPDDVMTFYGAGIGHYYLGEYEACMEVMEGVMDRVDDEMGVAAIYWHTLAAWRAKKEPVLLEKRYHSHMRVGHHTAYNKAMAASCGILSSESAMLMLSHEHSALEFSIFGYGYANYLEHIGKKEEAEELLKRVVADDGFWITYAYLAAWRESKVVESAL